MPAGRAPLSSQGPRRRIKELGAWETVSSTTSRPFEFCESSKATYKDLIYVVGGFLCDFNRVTDKIQMLNTTSGRWKTVAYLPATAAKTHHGAAVSRRTGCPERQGTRLHAGHGGVPSCVRRAAADESVWVRLLTSRK